VIFYKKGGEMKKIVIFGVVLAMIIFFTLPTMIFAEPGDDSLSSGPELDGQYVMDPLDADYADPPESVTPPESDRMEVYCIDEGVTRDTTGFDYEETDIDVSDELIANGEDPDVAEAVEIMATTATGADNTVNQNVVWDMITSLTGTELPVILDTTGEAVKAEVLALAEEFNNLPENNDADGTNDTDLQTFLEDKDINDLDVYLDTTTPFIEADGTANNEFIATAEMEEPLVPGVTDSGKTVFWYILGGSYNVSFASDSLVTEASSTMNDIDELGDDIADPTDPAYVASKDDNYGKSNINYYFFWWGDGFPEFEAMNVNLGAFVDIDEDSKIDIEQGPELDEFNTYANVVKVDGSGNVIKTGGMLNANGDPDPNGNIPAVETFVPQNIDIDYYNAGKILVSEDVRSRKDCEDSVYEDVYIDGHFTSREWDKGMGFWWCGHWIQLIPAHWDYCGWVSGRWVNGEAAITKPAGYYGICAEWQCEEIIHPAPYYQRFAIESYNEPSDGAEMLYSRWLDYTVNKTDSTDPDDKVEGATYKLTYAGGRTSPNSYPYQTEFTEITDANGQASFTGLPWGFYSLTEEAAPAGYKVHVGSYDIGIGGDTFFKANQQGLPETYGYIDVTDDPIGHHDDPIPEPEDEGTITVAGLTEGIQVLAFTGLDPIIPISGAGALMGGLGLLIASLKTRRNKKS
jgi:hypothetical protein